jgi:hypothetical protein
MVRRKAIVRREITGCGVALGDLGGDAGQLTARSGALQVIEDGQRLGRGDPDGLVATVVAPGSARDRPLGGARQKAFRQP